MAHRRPRWTAGPLALSVVTVLAAFTGCAANAVKSNRLNTVEARHFREFARTYRGLQVQIAHLRLERTRPDRPVLLSPVEPPTVEGGPAEYIAVHDGRGLVRRHHLAVGDEVTVVLQCLEGRTDRGNILLHLERTSAAPTAATGPLAPAG